MSLEGFSRHASTHAAGVVISPQPLQEIVPLYKSSKDELTTQYAMDDLEKIGLLKMDFLGLATLTILDDSRKLIESSRGEKIEMDQLRTDDAETYEMLGKGLTGGIFQFESRGMTDILRRVKPSRLTDLTALNALYRPGPIQMIDDFIARKTGRKKVTYDLPQLEDILAETYGVIVYQEQVMQIAASVAGFSLGEADVLRRAMGKKKREEMVAMREKFMAGAAKNNIPAKKAEKLFDLMEQFAGYGFNKSHSAAYALIAYQTAYLKAHYPVEFMASLLTAEIGNQEKLTHYLNQCRDMGIGILPPDVNSSDRMFTPSGRSIRFGLTAIKNVGEAAIESVIEGRKRLGEFENLYQFCENVDLRLLNKRVIESLIKAGAMDLLGAHRAQLMAALDRAMELGQTRQRQQVEGQGGLFGLGSQLIPVRTVPLPEVPEWTETEKLASEKEVLGFYITGHPLEKYREALASLTTTNTSSLEDIEHDSAVTVAGILTAIRIKPSKKGDLWASGTLEDVQGSVELLVFPQALQQIQNVLKKEAVLWVRGRIRHEENMRPKIVVNEAQSLEALVTKTKPQLLIRLSLTQSPGKLIERLEGILNAHPGDHAVVFELTQPGDFRVRLRCRKPTGIEPGEALIAELKAACGDEAVKLERPKLAGAAANHVGSK
jgi:DNA polymerase III subunit alpha